MEIKYIKNKTEKRNSKRYKDSGKVLFGAFTRNKEMKAVKKDAVKGPTHRNIVNIDTETARIAVPLYRILRLSEKKEKAINAIIQSSDTFERMISSIIV
jgi:hypothetical protein